VPEALARTLADAHRHSASRIAELGRESAALARNEGRGEVSAAHVTAAARRCAGGVGGLAEHLDEDVSDEALVAPASLRRELDDLVQRCRVRDRLVDGFGPALRARYRPCVRALFAGPSGTGKTLAAGWVASRLGLPLFRVDLAAITSKYIGETEKNLSRLLTRAEESEIVLLFDEADSMFGKRTEVRDAHDRFANAQTNFLLQKLESYEGIVLLTSNSRARIDAAFARRLDLVLEFPLPGPEERRSLWKAHLGESHTLGPADVNRVAVAAELSGGQIRTAVLTAALQAVKAGRPLAYADLLVGLRAEFRKAGRQLPEELLAPTVAA
jgi:SpoVK/Ycf46/Vps4 family AAA+-type ATPase